MFCVFCCLISEYWPVNSSQKADIEKLVKPIVWLYCKLQFFYTISVLYMLDSYRFDQFKKYLNVTCKSLNVTLHLYKSTCKCVLYTNNKYLVTLLLFKHMHFAYQLDSKDKLYLT